MATHLTVENRANNEFMPAPRLRASFNPATPMTITDTWTTIPYRMTGTFDVNTFTTVAYNITTNSLTGSILEAPNKQYDIEVFYQITGALLPIHDIQLRFCIPAPTPIYFPFPDTLKSTNIGSVLISPFASVYKQTIFFTAALLQYGCQIQIRTLGIIPLAINQPKLTDGALSLFPR